MARQRGNKGKKPAQPSGAVKGYPPPGTSDPGLQAQVRGGRRGLKDLRFDTRKAGRRETADFAIAQQELGMRQGGVSRDFQRDLYDLAVAEQRGTEDHMRALDALNRRYGQLAVTQSEQQSVGGASRGGAPAAAAAARTANQAFEQAPIDLSYQRRMQDIGLNRSRLGEDVNTSLTRLGLAGTELANTFRRGGYDRATKLSRAAREQSFFEQDTREQAYFQAHQFDPTIQFPSRPTGGRKRGRRMK